MKMFLLSADADTLTGLRLAGIDGKRIDDTEAFDDAVQEIASRSDVGILLVTRTLALRYPEQVLRLKQQGKLLVSEIPDMEHPSLEGDAITQYVRDAIGISV